MNVLLSIITLVGFPLAVVGVMLPFTKNILYLIFGASFSLICVIFVRFVIFVINNWHDLAWINAIKYFFTKNPNSNYVYESTDFKYEFLSRTKMKFSKNLRVKSTTRCLKSIDSRYLWTKLGKYRLVIESNNAELGNEWDDFVWHCYSVRFRTPLAKGQTADISVIMPDLDDPDKESSLCLSVEVTQKTKFLSLTVKSIPGLIIKNAELFVYNGSNNIPPKHKERLEIQNDGTSVKKTIKYPRVGYKYLIIWEFDNE